MSEIKFNRIFSFGYNYNDNNYLNKQFESIIFCFVILVIFFVMKENDNNYLHRFLV
jgi:hypothetical protein